MTTKNILRQIQHSIALIALLFSLSACAAVNWMSSILPFGDDSPSQSVGEDEEALSARENPDAEEADEEDDAESAETEDRVILPAKPSYVTRDVSVEDQPEVSEDNMVSRSTPPAREVEEIPVIENPRTEIWRPGYWILEDNHEFTWVQGKIIRRPDPSATWAPARWVRHRYGWTFEQGHWQ